MPTELLSGAALAAPVAAAVLLAVHFAFQFAGGRPRRGSALGAPLALGAGYLAGHWILQGLPPVPPLERTQWVFWLAAAATAEGLLEAFLPPLHWGRWPARGLIAAALPGLLVRWSGFSSLEGTGLFLGLGAALLPGWGFMAWAAGRGRGPVPFLILALWAAGVSGAVLLSGSALLGALGGALLAGLAATALVAWRRPDWAAGGPATGVSVTVLTGLLLIGRFLGELPSSSALLLASSPLMGFAAWSGLARRTGPRRSVLAGLVGALVPAALALVFAWRASPGL